VDAASQAQLSAAVPWHDARINDAMMFAVPEALLPFTFSWPSRFRGDSGSPVFLEAKDGDAVGLLSFHFLNDEGNGYALVTGFFFHYALDGAPGARFDFA
jgi:hypothetical protein